MYEWLHRILLLLYLWIVHERVQELLLVDLDDHHQVEIVLLAAAAVNHRMVQPIQRVSQLAIAPPELFLDLHRIRSRNQLQQFIVFHGNAP
jgi:hypothetical protein